MRDAFIVFGGTANLPLAEKVAQHLGVTLGARTIERFPDGEVAVWLDESVRRKEVFIVQSTSPPVDNHLVELLAFVDACRRSAAARITAVIPYFGYARSDKRHGRREPVTARMVADLLEAVGVSQVITVDLHAAQIEGFFHVPVDNLTAVPTLCQVLSDQLPDAAVIVSPDVGRLKTATEYARRLNRRVVVLHKERESATSTEVTHLVGEVRNLACLIIDDMISTGGTIASGVTALMAAGARPDVRVAATHGLLLEGARQKLSHSAIRAIYVTDTVNVPSAPTDWIPAGADWPQLRVVSLAPLLAEAISRVLADGSLRDLR
jgi:ribose-phosphate pyrophosphokinase